MVDTRQVKWQRQKLAHVFYLLGGELEDKPWKVDAVSGPEYDYDLDFPYWYEGAPDFLDEFPEATYRTIIIFSEPPMSLYDENGEWKLVQAIPSNGETECPKYKKKVTTEETVLVDGWGHCPLCESRVGMNHGMIYLGDGWAECVYKLDN